MRHQIITSVLILCIAAFHSTSFAKSIEDCALPPLKPIPEYTDLSSDMTRYELAYIEAYTFYRTLDRAGCNADNYWTNLVDIPPDHWSNPALEIGRTFGIHIVPEDSTFRGDSRVSLPLLLIDVQFLSGRLESIYKMTFPGQDETFKIFTKRSPDRQMANSWLFSHLKNNLSDGKASLFDVITALNKMVQYINENSPLITKEPVEIPKMANGCVDGMVRIETENSSYCIDVYEFPNQEGSIPYARMSDRAASLVCAMEGKRLCTAAEWETACRGTVNEAFVYGNHYVGGFCNDFLMSRGAGAAKASGATLGCVNGYGLYDMSGNLAEWTAPEPQPGGATVQRVRGGSFAEDDDERALACGGAKTPVLNEHGYFDAREFETYGTRCCMD